MNRLLLVFALICGLFFLGNFSLAKNLQTNIQLPMQYRYGDTTLSEVTHSTKWHSTNNLNSIKKRSDYLWVRIQLPRSLPSQNASLFVSQIYENYRMYEDGKLIDQFGNMKTFHGWSLGLIPLPSNSAGKTIYLKVQSSYDMIGPKGTIEAGRQRALITDIFRVDLTNIIVPVLMIGFGFFFLALGLLQRKSRYYLWLALSLIVDSGYLVGRTYIALLLYNHPHFWVDVRLYSDFAVPSLMIPFIAQFIGRFRIPMRVLWWAHTLFFILVLVFAFSRLATVDQFYKPFDDLVGVTMTVVGALVIVSSRRNAELRVLAVGFVSWMLTASDDVMVTTGAIPYQEYSAGQYGLLLLVLTIIAVHSNRYSNIYANMESYASELADKNVELVRLSKVKDEFLANTSHELRTPLNGILGITDSLIAGIGGPLNEVVTYNMGMIVASAKRLSNLVNDILDYSKLRHKELQLSVDPIDVSAVVRTVLETVTSLASQKGLELENHVIDPCIVMGDGSRLQQILYNLVGNAIKYTEKGTVEVAATSENGFAYISVKDTGIGIPEENLDQIFESFEQVDGSTIRQQEGTGLGLSITKSLVELHGGSIAVESVPEAGSTFTFSLPLAERELTKSEIATTHADHESPPRRRERKSADNQVSAGVFHILVVDDDPVNAQAVSNHLELHRWSSVVVHCGEDALSVLSTSKVDLVLLDVMMPRMSGYEVCRKIRETQSREALPVILLTAKNDMESELEGWNAGANDFLTKPFSAEALAARIDGHATLARFLQEQRHRANAVQTGTSFIRHAVKGNVSTINIFSKRVAKYAKEHHIDELARSAEVLIEKQNNLVALMDRINEFTSELQIKRMKSDMVSTLDAVLKAEKDRLDEAHVQLFIHCAPLRLELRYDRDHVKEVLHNIIENAVESMEDQEGPRHLTVALSSNVDGSGHRIVVEDTGPGIPGSELPYIFDRFYSTKTSRETNFGVGLYYCKRVMEKHGGTITAATYGNGTTITLYFPERG